MKSTTMTSLNKNDLIRLADLNLADFWCQSAKWIPHPEILHTRDRVFIHAALDFPACSFAFNLSLTTDESPEAFLNAAREFFRGRQKVFSLLLRGHADQALVAYCRARKFFRVSESPGMVLDAPTEPGPAPPGARLTWVDTPGDLAGFRQVVTEAYQDLKFPTDVSSAYFMHPQRVLEPQFILGLVHLNGAPAAAAMALLSHGIAGVYWVGTLKQARGLGLAQYCVSEVGNAAFSAGARKVILQASTFGEPVYVKLGYRQFTRYPWFMCSSK